MTIFIFSPTLTQKVLNRYFSISGAINARIRKAISHSISEWQSNKCRGVGNFTIFATKLVAMTTSLKISEKEGRFDHLPFNIYHTVQRLWKWVQKILRYFGFEQTIPVRNKIGCHGNVPWDIEKIISDLSSIPKTLLYGRKIAKIARGLCFAYDTKLVAMATSLEESEKLDLNKKIHANT